MIRPRTPAVHWPSVRGRARADTGPLLLAAVVVVVVTLLAGAAPPLLRAAADDAVRDAARAAGRDADVLAHARWEYDDGLGGRVRAPHLAEDMDNFRDRAKLDLDPALAAVLRPPVATVTGPTLKITDGSLLRTFQLTYLLDEHGPYSAAPRVTWVAGGPPRSTVDGDVTVPHNGPPWPVQVGLSEVDAAALGLRPGDRIPLVDQYKRVKNVQVSGIFRATDSADPTWRLAPWLLRPVAGADGVGTTRLGGLLSPDSLPDARLAFDREELDRTVRFSPDPDALDSDSAQAITAALATLKATSGASNVGDTSLKWESQLDFVLREVRTRVNAASAQASVLLTGVLAGAVLVLLLAADLLMRRRLPALATARQRGVGLADLGTELLIESTAVALVAAAAGLALARAVTPGVSWWSAVPVALAAAAAGPAFGTLYAARATRDRRAPANRAARRWIRQTSQLRRAALEAAVVIAAVAALAALHQRGIVPPSGAGGATGPWSTQDGGAALPSSAPALGAISGTLVLLWLLPAGTRLALRRALRSRRPLAVFATARAAATSTRALPLLVMAATAALASFALTLGTSAERGLADGAWRTVGADARLDVNPAAGIDVATLTRSIAAAPGVRQAVAAQVIDGARVTTAETLVTPRLVIVDAAAFQRLLATTPLPDAPALAQLASTGQGDVPALVRSGDGSLRTGMRLRLPREDAPAIWLKAVGTAPTVGETGDIVIVDAAALAAAGAPAVPNTVWVTGPGAAQAVTGHTAVLRADVLRERRTAPLTAGLLRLAGISAAALVALGLLGLALGAAAGAPERWQTLSRLRTLGLRVREARWVATGELLPPVAVAAIGGPLLGILLAHLTFGPLALRLIAGTDGDPAVAVPWWGAAMVAVAFLVAVAVVVPVESALRRRRRLSEVLRAGG